MATTTTNLGLTKPAYTETADISVINSNMDTIDSAIKSLQDTVSSHTSSISSLQDSVPKAPSAWTQVYKKTSPYPRETCRVMKYGRLVHLWFEVNYYTAATTSGSQDTYYPDFSSRLGNAYRPTEELTVPVICINAAYSKGVVGEMYIGTNSADVNTYGFCDYMHIYHEGTASWGLLLVNTMYISQS